MLAKITLCICSGWKKKNFPEPCPACCSGGLITNQGSFVNPERLEDGNDDDGLGDNDEDGDGCVDDDDDGDNANEDAAH